ncbi:N-acetylglucosamine-6-phosphate deacetylase [Aureibaculum marinum]|uniref:N-acetylglucosamine-6-phosphate deacetylase n=1 Tax=Aureibaculum marinum TaxID=2487930 RepID=A0A3N4NK10_9FLAO|nr:amidohydrolase family protein [Aureibaculum marinum]RPD95845.1 N-acetylglucosamine-6-phosphate deacetylase [Aureibaculum marinum]
MKIEGLDYRTNNPISVHIDKGYINLISECHASSEELYYIAPGLVDLQINGFNGIDFNTKGLTISEVKKVTQQLLKQGVTSYFPTVITNSDNAIESLLNIIAEACNTFPEVDDCISGIHLEGPFISLEDGPRGAHSKDFIKAPNWDLFSKWQKASGNRIKIITLSPEWPESTEFIKSCVHNNVVVSIGHTAATTKQINEAIEAGASMSTHLGNASHAMLPRHSNYVIEQLASDSLWSSLIADGFHLPDALLKVFLRAKSSKSILVSDATSYAGLLPGTYKAHIGGDVILDSNGRLFMKNSPKMLAGSAQSLLWCVNQLVNKEILSLHEAWNLASIKPTESIVGYSTNLLQNKYPADLVIFKKEGKTLNILKTIKSGRLVFSSL